MGRLGNFIIRAGFIIFFVYVLFFLARFLFADLWLQKTKLDYDFALLDIVSLLITSIIAIWIGWYVAKKLSEQRFEKDFLIDDLRLIEKEIQEIDNVFKSSRSVDITLVTSINNKVNALIDRFEETLTLVSINLSTDELQGRISDLYSISTDLPSSNEPIENIDVQSISVACDRVIIESRKLVIKINNR